MAKLRKGTIVVLHLAFRYPLAGVVWQLLHHLVGFRRLGLDVYYLEDHAAYVYDPAAQTPVPDAGPNLSRIGAVLERFGFAGRWAFLDPVSGQYVGMERTMVLRLLREADAVINLCAATSPRAEHEANRCLVYLETDPGPFQARLEASNPTARIWTQAHKLFFSYGHNLGEPGCLLPTGGLSWRHTWPPVLLDEWHDGVGSPQPRLFTTVGTWANSGLDLNIGGKTYFWSKHLNFRQVLEAAKMAEQPIELATDLTSGPDYERALAGGFTVRPAVPMSLDIDDYRRYISESRGEFTVAKDLYVRTRSGWFSDRSACYLAAGRPVVTQYTGFERTIPSGLGLVGFDTPAEAVDALRRVNADYARHARAARELAVSYFDANKLLSEIAEAAGL